MIIIIFRFINKNETMKSNASSRKKSCIQIPGEFIVSFTDKDSLYPSHHSTRKSIIFIYLFISLNDTIAISSF